MDEKLIDYFFGFAQSKGFKRNREDFVKYLQSDDKLFDYLYGVAESKGYKRDKEHFAGLVGRTQKAAPVSTESTTTESASAESVKSEPVNAEPVKATDSAKSEPVKAEPVAEETATDYSGVDTTPMERKGERSTPIKGIDQITVDKVDLSDKEKADRLKSVRKGIDERVVNDAIESKLMPVTEKTQVKEVVPEEKKKVVPTDIKVKDVTQEDTKLKVKDKKELSNAPLETIKLKPGEYSPDIPNKVPGKEAMPSEVYKPYGEKGPDVYYSKDFDEYIIKDDKGKKIVSKGSSEYNEIDKKIGESVKSTVEGTGKCDPETGASCSAAQISLSNFLNLNYDDIKEGNSAVTEGSLINILNEKKYNLDNHNATSYEMWEGSDRSQLWYANDEFPKDKRFVTYKPYGDNNTLIYDKDTGIIFKQLDEKVPSSNKVVDYRFDYKSDKNKKLYQDYKKNNPNEGMNIWYAYERDRPGYKELKSLIDGVDYKKEKGTKNTFVPLSPNFDPTGTPDWMKQ